MKQGRYGGPTNIRGHRTKCSRNGDMLPGIFSPLGYSLCWKFQWWKGRADCHKLRVRQTVCSSRNSQFRMKYVFILCALFHLLSAY